MGSLPWPRGRRVVSWGSSANTVPIPTTMASTRCRRRWPKARAASPVSHWLSPPTVAILPSREQAALAMTHGRPVFT